MADKIYDLLLREKDLDDYEAEKISLATDQWLINQFTSILTSKIANMSTLNEKLNLFNSILQENSMTNLIVKNSNQYTKILDKLSLNNLIYNFGEYIYEEFMTSQNVYIISPFINSYTVNDLRNWMEMNSDLNVHILTTTYDGTSKFLSLSTLQMLKKDKKLGDRIHIKIEDSFIGNNERIHAKLYFFERDNGFSNVYVGSNNFTKTGIYTGKEWSLKFSEFREKQLCFEVKESFYNIWQDPNLIDISDDKNIERLINIQKQVNIKEKQYQQEVAKIINHNSSDETIHLFEYQKDVVKKIFQRIRLGKTKHLIVMATGTGKTITTAQIFANLFHAKQTKNFKFLFISHQKEISEQAFKTFNKFNNKISDDTLFIFDGQFKGSKIDAKQRNNLFIFATFQSIKKYTKEVSNINWDLVIFDEVHHIEANTFKNIFNSVEPNSDNIIGLTATPDRTDGINVEKYFDGEYAFNLSLYDSLKDGLLCPFEYYFIEDNSTDLTDVDIYRDEELGYKLSNPQRNQLIYDYIENHIGNNNINLSAVLFCASISHANYVKEFLLAKGLTAQTLTSADNKFTRQAILTSFKNKEINYLCVRDIFNEGIDVPEIDTIMLLRPTTSLLIYTQQLGRGLRKVPNKKLQVYDFVNNVDLYKNKKFNPVMLPEILGINHQLADQVKIKTIKDFSLFLPFGSQIRISDDMSDKMMSRLLQYEKTKKIYKSIKSFDGVLNYEKYAQLFNASSFVRQIKPFDLYGSEKHTFLQENESFNLIFKNFSVCNFKNVIQIWAQIATTKVIDLSKKSHQLFLVNLLSDKLVKQFSLNLNDLEQAWDSIISLDFLFKELTFLFNYKLDYENLIYNDHFNENDPYAYKGMIFTYHQIKILTSGFDKVWVENKISTYKYIKSTTALGIYSPSKSSSIKIIYTSEDEGDGIRGYVNKYLEKNQTLIWNSPLNWYFNSQEKIDLIRKKYLIFYNSQEVRQAFSGSYTIFLGLIDHIISRESIEIKNKNSNIKYKFYLV